MKPVIKELTADDGTKAIRYYRPVPVMASCLACHGSGNEIAPNVRAAIAKQFMRINIKNAFESERGRLVRQRRLCDVAHLAIEAR